MLTNDTGADSFGYPVVGLAAVAAGLLGVGGGLVAFTAKRRRRSSWPLQKTGRPGRAVDAIMRP